MQADADALRRADAPLSASVVPPPESGMGRAVLHGLAVDAGDGHVRLTLGDHFQLSGGSESSHRAMRRQAETLVAEIERQGFRLDRLAREDVAAVRLIIDRHMAAR